ncbi:hypothetical protein [Vulgatibacter sp.]|uniref:hypothetical protein n=1 Tax=Vulgatibacter sp. TaxID=1971226 RepID=UPI003562FF86
MKGMSRESEDRGCGEQTLPDHRWEVEDLREAVNKMPSSPFSTALVEQGGGEASPAEAQPNDTDCTTTELPPFGASSMQHARTKKRKARTRSKNEANPGLCLERETGFEPATLSLGIRERCSGQA